MKLRNATDFDAAHGAAIAVNAARNWLLLKNDLWDAAAFAIYA